jgi:hypothetical protein
MSKGHGHHSHNLEQEVFVARVFWIVIVVFFLLQLFLIGNSYGVMGPGLLQEGGMTLLWQAIVIAWSRLAPIFIVLNVLCLGVFLFSLVKVWPLRQKISIFSSGGHGHGDAHGGGHGATTESHASAPQRNPVVLKHWTDIVKRANTGTPENLRWAVMESDALVDFVLKDRQVLGETMADRLANFRREEYKSIDKLWDAHKLRNEIAHTPGFKLTSRQAEKALLAFRDFLKELKAF